MIARALGGLCAMALAATVGFVAPPTATESPVAAATTASAPAGFDVQQAVQRAFAEVLPDQGMHFALDTAQTSPVDGGGQRFEGSGIGTFGQGDAQFIAFTLTLSARGEMVEFDYSAASPAGEVEQLAAY